MRIGTAALILLASFAGIACGKKSSEDAKAPPEAKPGVSDAGMGIRRVDPEIARRATSVDNGTAAAAGEGIGEAESPPDPPPLEIKVGATYVLSQGRETVVMNPKPVDDGLRRFKRGATCRVDPEAKVKIVGKRVVKEGGETYDEYLVRYAREPSAEALLPGATSDADAQPYECPNGTVFYLDEPDLLEEDEPDPRYDEARKLLDSEKP